MHPWFPRTICGLALACAAWTAAAAQTPADAPLPVTPQRLALAEQVVEATGAKANGARIMDVMANSMIKGMQTTSDSELTAYLGQLLRDEMRDMQGKIGPIYAEIYARTFTDQQLNDLLAFYGSPTGRMLLAKMPEVLRQSQLAVAPLVPALQRDMIDKIFDHICTVQKCTAKQRDAMADAKAKALERIGQPPAQAQP